MIPLFQSTPPRGKRHRAFFVQDGRRLVSIHAPAREATSKRNRGMTSWPSCFNPRPRAGSDSFAIFRHWLPSCFNPRPRAGSDVARRTWVLWNRWSFQSTPPRGKRPGFLEPSLAGNVSIHAPAREATLPRSRSVRSRWFQSTPPRGKRPGRMKRKALTIDVSIHAPAREATRTGRRPPLPMIVSIHAPAREATPTRCCAGSPECFNPRPRAGSDEEAA